MPFLRNERRRRRKGLSGHEISSPLLEGGGKTDEERHFSLAEIRSSSFGGNQLEIFSLFQDRPKDVSLGDKNLNGQSQRAKTGQRRNDSWM